VCVHVCMYVYSRGGPHTALTPRPSLIYCAFFVSIPIELSTEFVRSNLCSLSSCSSVCSCKLIYINCILAKDSAFVVFMS
jgi:hypothetical protein